MLGGEPVCFLLDQAYKWTAFAGLLYLFLWSLPGWVKGSVQELVSWLSHGTVGRSQRGDADGAGRLRG